MPLGPSSLLQMAGCPLRLNSIPVYMCTRFFHQWSLSCTHVMATVDDAAVNMGCRGLCGTET